VERAVLHVGAFKTGTSFIQDTMSVNKQALSDAGVLFPGERWPDQIEAVRALTRRSEPGAPQQSRSPDAWDALVSSCHAWHGPLAVVSMEFLSTARPAVVTEAIASLSPAQVQVVLGARVLTEAIPAQWQESIQSSGRTWTLAEYAEAVMSPDGRRTDAGRHFWRRHNWPQLLARWAAGEPASVVLLTVPRRGAAPEVLWHRFGVAATFDASDYPVAPRANESLGAASLEVARRVNLEVHRRGLSTAGNPTFRRLLCKRVMASRRRREPGVTLPPGCETWLSDRTRTMIKKIRRLAPVVVGDLDELMPAPVVVDAGATTAPELLPDDDLLEAAMHAAAGLVRARAIPWAPPSTGAAGERLASVVTALADFITAPP
jgi:hypothetical protein